MSTGGDGGGGGWCFGGALLLWGVILFSSFFVCFANPLTARLFCSAMPGNRACTACRVPTAPSHGDGSECPPQSPTPTIQHVRCSACSTRLWLCGGTNAAQSTTQLVAGAVLVLNVCPLSCVCGTGAWCHQEHTWCAVRRRGGHFTNEAWHEAGRAIL